MLGRGGTRLGCEYPGLWAKAPLTEWLEQPEAIVSWAGGQKSTVRMPPWPSLGENGRLLPWLLLSLATLAFSGL